MVKNYKQRDLSVLNTDSFDKRRFKTLIDSSKGLQKVVREARKNDIPYMEPLLGDIWASLYKMKPQIKETVEHDVQSNKSIIERIMSEESFEGHRKYSKLDELTSAVGTVKIGEQTREWLNAQRQKNEELEKAIQEILKLQNEKRDSKKAQEQMNDAMDQLNNQIQHSMQEDSSSLSQALSQAIQETQDVTDNVKTLLGGSLAGNNAAELKRVPIRDQLKLAEALSANQKLKKIAEWAGRFQQIARQKQKTKHTEAIDRNGVTIGNDVERLLPSELALYMSPKTKTDFMRRFVEGQTLQYEQIGKEMLGKGPIIVCLDQSGSMDKLDLQSKGFVLALMSIAKKQKRDFALVLFSTITQIKKYPRGKITASDMVDLATTFLDGGTDFVKPLQRASEIINESRFKKADIIFVTDGQDNVSEGFLKSFSKLKTEKEFNVLSLVIGNGYSVQRFSDKVVSIKNFNDQGAFEAFEI